MFDFETLKFFFVTKNIIFVIACISAYHLKYKYKDFFVIDNMTEREIRISYAAYGSADEMEAADRELVEAAIKATEGSYAPYSNFNVGAAVRLDDGKIVSGSNQENAAFPSGLCAERTAMFYANAAYPDTAMVSLAIAGGQNGILCDSPATPCGACRQVMAEYQKKGGKPISVILVGKKVIWKFDRVDDLLPLIFDSI